MADFYTKYLWLTTRYTFYDYPKSVVRLLNHVIPFFRRPVYKIPAKNAIEWFGDLVCYVAEVLLISYFVHIVAVVFKPNQRFLKPEEVALSKEIFGGKIQYEYVTIHPHMSRFMRRYAMAYVSGNTINFQDRINKRIFIHEMVHIWQYQRLGLVYAWRALKAQQEPVTYDYGGLESLYASFTTGKNFYAFNFEQQAQIIEDYFSLMYNYRSYLHPMYDAIYAGYLKQMLDDDTVV